MFTTKRTQEVMKMKCKKFFTVVLTIALCAVMILPAYAATNPFAAMEAKSHQALDAAIKAGTVPADATIFDCMFTTGDDGVTRVVQYRDKNGSWIDVTTQKKAVVQEKTDHSSNGKADVAQKLSEQTLAEYAAEVFRLVNEERENAGLDPLERDVLLDEAAMIRAAEVKIVDDAGGKPHTRPDGTSFRALLNDMGIDGDRCAENLNRAKSTPQSAMESWMKSDGHREIILRERYGTIGIGVYQRSDGKLDWIQIFERK